MLYRHCFSECTIRRVQKIQNGLQLNVTHQLLVYADGVNILGGSLHTTKENAEALVAVNKEIVTEVNADRTKYMVKSRDQNAGRSHSIKNDNSSFERVEEFKYLGRAQVHKDLRFIKLNINITS
jgi:hypothetical protein